MIPSAANDGATPPVAVIPLASSHFRKEPVLQGTERVFHLGYRRWLDGLRGVAILLVLAFHVGLLPGGFLGVDIFFVLSGFLITSLLMEEWQSSGVIRLKPFYLRRALRLSPAFFVLLFLCGLTIPWLPSAEERWGRCREVAVAASYLSNWPMLHRTSMPILGHTWSLSVEEQFYLLWPILLCFLLRLRLTRLQILSLVSCWIGASAALRMGLYHWHQNHGMDRAEVIFRLYRGLDTRADALLVGCLLALLAAWNMLPRSRRFLRWTGAASLICVVYLGYLACYRRPEETSYYHGLFTVVALMTALILSRLLFAPPHFACRILESAPLVGTGRISYALYLFHMPVLHVFLPVGVYLGQTVGAFWGYAAFVLLVVGLSFLAAVLSYYLVERPCLRLKDRLRPRTEPDLPPVLRLPRSDLTSGSARAAA